MNSYSQAGQDLFVHALHPLPGFFLDIGAGFTAISNTLALEEVGWQGWCIDNSESAAGEHIEKGRRSEFICADATILPYHFLHPTIDYLSLDVDGASLSALLQLPLTEVKFGIITIEHDAYRFGDGQRAPMRSILRGNGYKLLCADVCHDGQPFEDWWIHPELVDLALAEKFFRNEPTDWKEILGL